MTSLAELFQSKSQKQSKELLEAVSAANTPEAFGKLLASFDQKLFDYTKGKKDLSQPTKDKLDILGRAQTALEKLQKGDGSTFESDVKGVLSYRSHSADNGTFGFAHAAAFFMTEKRDNNGRCFASQQADGIAALATHLEDYSRYVGSGNAGYANMQWALGKYSQAAKAYDSFGQKSKGDDQAKKLQACAERQGHRLTESGQAWVDARFQQPGAKTATYG